MEFKNLALHFPLFEWKMEINSSQVDSHSSGVAEPGPLILLVFYLSVEDSRVSSLLIAVSPLCKDIHTLVKNYRTTS